MPCNILNKCYYIYIFVCWINCIYFYSINIMEEISMKLLVLDGFEDDDTSCCDKIYECMQDVFTVNNGIKRIRLSRQNIAPCTGCFGCWVKTPGKCFIKDDSQKIIETIITSDTIIYFTPVIFGGYSPDLKKILDRTICLVSPFFTKVNKEMHHKKRYDKYPSLIGIGLMEKYNKEQEENFKNLIYRNSLNFHSPFECAEIILKDDTEDIIKEKLSASLNNIGVNK